MQTLELEDKIHQAVVAIPHPEIQSRTLGELGMLQSISVTADTVHVEIALPLLQAQIKETLLAIIEQAIQEVDRELHTAVRFVHMSPENRAAFMAVAKTNQQLVTGVKHIACVLAVMSGKGGVGKSSVAGMLATSLCRRGLRTGILDADITGPSIPKMFGVNEKPVYGSDGITPAMSRTGIKLMSINLLLQDQDQAVIWRGPMISRAIEQFWNDIAWGDLDYLVVDLPPGTSDAALTVTQSLPLHGVVMVTSPQDLAGMIVRKAANMVQQMEVPLIGVIENMSHVICPQCGTPIYVFGSSRATETAHMVGTSLLGRLPLDPSFAMLCDAGEIENYSNDAFEAIVEKILSHQP